MYAPTLPTLPSLTGTERVPVVGTGASTFQYATTQEIANLYSGGGGGGVTSINVNSNFNLSTAYNSYYADPSAGPFTGTLPASPATNAEYVVKDITGYAGTNAITIAGGGANIDGAANITINVNYGWVRVRYTGSQWSQLT